MDAGIRELVRSRAGNRCEYCLLYIGISRLAAECLAVVESREKLGMGPRVRAAALESPAIRRLRPKDVTAGVYDLQIELHGGYDHYGYELLRDLANHNWVLRRYGRHARVLKSWPVGSSP
jgi:hypothetical protein